MRTTLLFVGLAILAQGPAWADEGCPSGYYWNGCECVQQISPIILDTTGQGFNLTSAADGVVFDIAGTGHPVHTAWTAAGSGNAFLALDRNHNGRIDNGRELFGSVTAQPKSHDPNGFLALAVFDEPENGGNGDGIIDFRDEVYSHLLLWIDENHDGISQPDELHSLPELGVYSMALNYVDSRYTDIFGNQFRYKAVLNPDPLDGQSSDGHWAYDVFFLVFNPTPGQNQCLGQIPTSIPVIDTVSSGPSVGCDPGQAGWTRFVTRQLEDQNNEPIVRANDQIVEVVTMGNNGLQLPAPHNTTASTNGGGQIGDNLSFCSTLCPSSTATTTQSQVITDSVFPLGTYTIVFSCKSVTVNGK